MNNLNNLIFLLELHLEIYLNPTCVTDTETIFGANELSKRFSVYYVCVVIWFVLKTIQEIIC